MPSRKARSELPTIGWREWVALPGLGISAVKAKVDTGARSSSIHALNIEIFRQDGKAYVRFAVHPLQRDTKTTVHVEAPLLEHRRVRSSGGHETIRPVVVTEVELLGQRWLIELTLANRVTMGFRMLLGRQAIRRRFLVDPAGSYYGGDWENRHK
jgi:hypothetical protein